MLAPLKSAAVLLLVLLAAAPLLAFEPEASPPADESDEAIPAGHSYHGEAFNHGPRQRAHLMEGTGRVDFPITTGQPQAQQFFNQGVGQLHGFLYLEAERSFRQAAALDPDCAMLYWGMARANANNETRAKKFIAEAVARKQGASPREAMYIDALDAFYKADAAKKKERGEAYVKALERIAIAYPDDLEAKSLVGLQVWLNRGSGVPISSHLAVNALLRQVLEAEPLHPCHHYVIHLWDNEKPEMALESAARCGPAAPAIAHMWHMPGHIYSRLKRYGDAAWQQEASARVDHAHMIRYGLLPDQIHNFAHNNEWLIRNLNHVGRVHDAVDLAKNMIELPRHPRYNTLDKGSSSYGRARLLETLARYELWDDLIALAGTRYLEPTSKETEQVKRLRHLGAARFRSGSVDDGRDTLAELETWLQQQQAARDAAIAEAQAKVREEAGLAAKPASEADAVAAGDSPAENENAEEQDPANAPPPDKDLTKKLDAAKNKAEAPFKAKINAAEKALDELQGHVAVAEGKFSAALDLFKKAGGVDNAWIARVQLMAGQADAAEKTLRDAIKKQPSQVQPQSALVDVLWQAGKRDDAAAALDELRKLAAHADLDVPPLARLAPIVRELGLPDDWRERPEPAADLGERPPLDSLGPFRWHPAAAPDWKLVDAEGRKRKLGDFRGRPVVLIFYLGHGCLHCIEQLQAFGPRAADFSEAGLALAAISTDAPEDLRKSQESYNQGEFPFPLFSGSDLAVFKAYRAYDDFENQPLHGTFILDADGLVRWHDIGHEPFMNVEFALEEAQRLLTFPAVAEPVSPSP